jgi:hypothetical protein
MTAGAERKNGNYKLRATVVSGQMKLILVGSYRSFPPAGPITEHINRFGVYEWNPERTAPPLNYDIEILSPQSFAR